MRFRDAREDELDLLHRLNQAEVPHVGDVSRERFGELARICSDLVVADDEGHLAGFVLLFGPGAPYTSPNYRWFSGRYADFAYVDRIVVAPTHRRRGVGEGLYLEAERRRPTAWLLAEVNLEPPNPGSMAFHRRQGFALVGHRGEEGSGYRVAMLAKRRGGELGAPAAR